MNKYKLCFIALCFAANVHAQENIDSLHANASKFIMKGDAENALMILNRAKKAEPNNPETQKLIAFTYYNQRDFASAIPYANAIAANPQANFQQIQMAGLVYKAIAMYKEAETLYKNAMFRFPDNGVLLSEYGELMFLKKEDNKAIKLWEEGIKADPNIASNYYFASKYYSATADLLWAVIYAEQFVNIESFSERTAEIKAQLLRDYKKLFQNPVINNKANYSDFSKAVLSTLFNYSNFTNNGVTAETLNIIRQSFIKEWNAKYAAAYPFRLFDYYTEMLKAQCFEAYNYWLFSENAQALRSWAVSNKEQFNNFLQLQNNKLYKLPKAQYYSH